MASKAIYEKSTSYRILRILMDPFIKGCLRRYVVAGAENLPSDGELIFAPNHCCALLDPLSVLIINKDMKVFVARADIFAKPFFNKLLTFIKIMPINRRRDGIRNMTKTEETIKKSIEVLNNGVDFCILPEGTHRPMHSLLPIGKGISRVAYGAYEAGEGKKTVYIVPVGVEYGDYFRLRSGVLVSIGEPIDATRYILDHQESGEHVIMQDFRSMLEAKLKELIVYIKDDEDYAATWVLSRIASGSVPERDLKGRFKANKAAVEKIEKFKEEQPERAAMLFDKALAFARARENAKVSQKAFYRKNGLMAAVLRSVLCIILLPLFAVEAVASLAMWLPAELLSGKLKDHAFRNSIRSGLIAIIWPWMSILAGIVFFCTLRWWIALAALILFAVSPFVVYDCFELARQCASAWRYCFAKGLRARYAELKDEMGKM
jgi:1-acyl-sn-glycerol-3-phosphate acyltransferase